MARSRGLVLSISMALAATVFDQPIHTVADGENRKTGTGDRSGRAMHAIAAAIITVLSFVVAGALSQLPPPLQAAAG
jgi:hypothetical protein